MAYNLRRVFKKYFLPGKNSVINFSSSAQFLPKSSLLISGERAVDTFVVVIPKMDFDKSFSNFSQLEENIKRRRLNFNLVELKESWEFYKDWNTKKLQLEENLKEAQSRLKKLSENREDTDNSIEIKKLEIYRSLVKEDLHQVKKNVCHMEDNVIFELLTLPNVIHPETPDEEDNLFVIEHEDVKESFDHLLSGVKLNCLEYHNELDYFLKNKAALFELSVPELFIDTFASQGFIRFSNPDFARSVLAEGVTCTPNNTSDMFLLQNTEGNNDLLHLCGGASLFPFCGFHAKHSVPKKSLPLKYIASGRQFCPITSSLPGLYRVNQSTSVQLFIATYSEEEMFFEFKSCVDKLSDVFTALGFQFKIAKQPPHLLKNWESLRVSIQVFSPHEKVFVEVGSVSLVGDFVSKRLRMCCLDENEPFLKVVSGTAVNTQTLLALCLERSKDELFIPEVVKNYMIR